MQIQPWLKFTGWVRRKVQVETDASVETRRSQILNVFLIGGLGLIAIITLADSANLIELPGALRFVNLMNNAAIGILSFAVWRLNRAGYRFWASVVYVIIVVLFISFGFVSMGLDHVVVLYAIPIVASSFIVAPSAAFLIMLLAWGGYTLMFFWSGAHWADYNIISILALFALALSAQFTAALLERSLAQTKQSELRFQTLIQNVGEGIGQVRIEGSFIFANPMLEKIFGLPPGGMLGRNVNEFISPEQKQVLDQQVTQRKQGIPGAYDLEITRANDGATRLVRVTATPWFDSAGQYNGAFGVFRDETELRRAEAALRQAHVELEARVQERTAELRESQSFYQSLVEVIPQCLCRKDLAGKFTFGNQRYCDEIGYSLAELIGKTDYDLHPAVLAEEYRRDDRQVIETGQTFDRIEEHTLTNGLRSYVHVLKTPLCNSKNQIAGVQIIFWDVTQQYLAQQTLQQARDELELRVQERTAALAQANTALHRSAEQLAALNDAAFKIQRYLNPAQIYRVACDELRRLGTFASVYNLAMTDWAEHVRTSMSKENLAEYIARFGDAPIEIRLPIASLEPIVTRVRNGDTLVESNLMARVSDRLPPAAQAVLGWMRDKSGDRMLLAPITENDTPIGMLVVMGEQLGAEDTIAVALFARQVSAALDNARLYLAEKMRREELGVLYDLSRHLATTDTQDVIMNAIVRTTVEMVHVTYARLVMLENDGFLVRAMFPIRELNDTVELGHRESPAVQMVYQRILNQNAPLVLRTNDPELDRKAQNELFLDQVQTVCVIPLHASEQFLGVLVLGEARSEAREPFDAEKLRLARAIGNQAASAIHRANLHTETERAAAELANAYEATLEGWVHALDLRDNETEGHSLRVMYLTEKLAQAYLIDQATLAHIRRGALLHDVGKMAIPDPILLKPNALDENERRIMERHPEYARQLLQPIAYLRPALDIPYGHHEKWDGTGYPRGLRGEDIPLAARLFAVVDVWDALCSNRPYRTAWPLDRVCAYIRARAGTHFDPKVVEKFLAIMNQPTPIEPE